MSLYSLYIAVSCFLPRTERTMAPMIMRMVWMKSVQMTADRPPATVKRQAMPYKVINVAALYG